MSDEFQNPRFQVCDNDFQGAPDSHPVCEGDGTDECEDADPAEGSIRAAVASGTYSVEQIEAPDNHTADGSKLACDASTGKCGIAFASTPNNYPWFPWDTTGPGGNPGGAVSGLDIFEVLQHFGETKP